MVSMFSRRKSREPSRGPLPGNQSTDVNSNALAAASAIGHALKTGNPIPRSNSLQRTGSLQRLSYGNSKMNRSSSFLGLQTKSSFQFDSKPIQPPRSQSLVDATKLKGPKPGAASKPRTIKKHVPGPYGLVTIEVPIEEEEERIKKSHRKSSFTKTVRNLHSSDNGSLRSLNSNSSIRRTVIVDHLKDVQEDFPLDFDCSSQPKPFLVEKNHDLDSIVEETQQTKEALATQIELESIQDSTQPEIVPLDESKPEIDSEVLKEEPATGIVGTADDKINIITGLDSKPLSEIESDVSLEKQKKLEPFINSDIEETTDEAPSTAKSADLSNETQSSYTEPEQDEVEEVKFTGGSMAQQLRPRIFVNKEDGKIIDYNDYNDYNNSLDLKPTESAQSSVYSAEPSAKSDDEIPSRSAKRDTLKSALKNRSTTSVNVNNEKPNPASAAYLSLTTAENTRLNALSTKQKSTLSNGHTNNQNGPKTVPVTMRQTPLQKPNGARPQSVQITRSPSKSTQKRPQSQFTNTTQPQPQSRPVKKSPSNLAAVNATMKKDTPKPPSLVKKSSFDKDRPTESHAAFKRMSLRDPSVNHQYAQIKQAESNLGFYRDQATNSRGFPHHHQPQHTQQSQLTSHYEGSVINGSTGGYRSRFNDSDSDTEDPVPYKGLAPPHNQTLRKPRSQFSLRNTSVSTVPAPSPQKSLPEQRTTRFFSESAELGQSSGHEQKKKKGFGGKLKKLFGRSKD